MVIRALLFDMDGVLVNTEPIHMQAWQETLAPIGVLVTKEELLKNYIGLNDRDFLEKIFAANKKRLIPKIKKELIRQKEECSRKALSRGIPLIKGVQKFLETTAKKYPFALVTGALQSEAYFILDEMRWRRFFPIIITSAEVVKGKPNPEGFLKAFEKLKKIKNWNPPLKKSECLILEDSKNGIKAAKRAKIPYLLVKKTLIGVKLP